MDKFRIYSASLGVDYTPARKYIPEIEMNISEVSIQESPFTGKKDGILFAQYDRYAYDIQYITATEYEDVFKAIINQQVRLYPDSSSSAYFNLWVVIAKPYYLNDNNYKDALYIEFSAMDYSKENALIEENADNVIDENGDIINVL